MAFLEDWFDAFARRWGSAATTARIGRALVLLFLGALVVIEAGRRGWLPAAVEPWVSTSHFGALNLIFAVLLIFELVSMVVAVPASTAAAFGKQLEVFSLLLLRLAVHELPHVGEPVDWSLAKDAIGPMVADIAGGLAIYALLGLHAGAPRRESLAGDASHAFVAAKKRIAVLLLVVLAVVVVTGLFHAPRPGEDLFHFMTTAFTVLIFNDVLLMLVALQYTAEYRVVFRNAGYTALTILMRLSLTAPDYINVGLGVGAAAGAVAMAWIGYWFPAIGGSYQTSEFTARTGGPRSGRAPLP